MTLRAFAGALLAFIAAANASPQTPRATFGVMTSRDLGTRDPVRLAVADLNRDGHLDLVVSSKVAPLTNVNVLNGDGTGLLTPAIGLAFTEASALAVADFDGDGWQDLVVTQDMTSKGSFYGDVVCGSTIGIAIFLGPDFSSGRCIGTVPRAIAVQTGDFDGDGRPDIAVASASALGIQIYGQLDFVTYGLNIISVPSAHTSATNMTVADLNGDGNLDLVVSHAAGVRTFLGNGNATFSAGGSAGTSATQAAAVGDLNGDGIPDVASVETTNGHLVVAFGAGDGVTFTTQAIAAIGSDLSDVAAADIDRDGRQDIVVVHRGGARVHIFYGNGDGTFAADAPLAIGVSPKLLAIRDWDEDGDLDLAVVDSNSTGLNAVAWIALQDGGGVPGDRRAPLVTVPSNLIAEASAASGAIVTYTASALDAVDGNLAATCNPASGATFPLSTTTVTCSATDSSGNTGSASFAVTVRDTTAPVVAVPPDTTVEATSGAGASFLYTATATDLVDGVMIATCDAASGATFPLGATPVTCSAADAHGNTSAASFTVTVRDTTAPAIAAHDDVTVEATSSTGATVSYASPATVDAVDGSGTAACAPPSATLFPLGDTPVTCDAIDAAGNHAASRFAIHVVDRTAPTLTVPGNVVLEATTPAGAPHLFVATATDVVDGAIAPSCVPGSGSIVPVGTTTVSCAAADAHGNTATASFTVTVRDTTPPVVTAPAAITVAATEAAGARGNIPSSLDSQRVQAFVIGGAAADLYDVAPVRQAVEATIGDAIVAVAADMRFPVGTTPVTFRYRDASGNIGSAASTVTVTSPIGGIVDVAGQAFTATDAANVAQPVTAAFAGVTQPGLLTAEAMLVPPAPPAGFDFVGPVFDVVTTALAVPPIDVCLLGTFPADARVQRYDGATWRDALGPTTTATGICAQIDALSPLAVVTAANAAPTAQAGAAQTLEMSLLRN